MEPVEPVHEVYDGPAYKDLLAADVAVEELGLSLHELTPGHGAADVPPAERLLPGQKIAASFCDTATFSPGANSTLASMR